MKITREIVDNDKNIIHIDYTKKDVNTVVKRIKERSKMKQKEDAEIRQQVQADEDAN